MELQDFHLTPVRGMDCAAVLALMQVQNTYIQQVYRVIYALSTDINIATNGEFQEFAVHFMNFAQHHFSSDGFCRALDTIQMYHYVYFEKLLDTQVLAAAEQLELAVTHLEMVARETKSRGNPQLIVLLNHGITVLEETQLKIIESLEKIVRTATEKNQLQN